MDRIWNTTVLSVTVFSIIMKRDHACIVQTERISSKQEQINLTDHVRRHAYKLYRGQHALGCIYFVYFAGSPEATEYPGRPFSPRSVGAKKRKR